MKILYVLNSSNFGGMEWHVNDLIVGMRKKGHQVFVWCPSGQMMDIYKESGAVCTDASIKFDIDPVYILKLIKFIKSNSIDVIHSHELKAVTNSLLAGFFAGVKVRISHTHTPISEWKINPVVKYFTLLGYSFLVNTFSTTEISLTESKKKVKIKEGIKEKKLTVIPNGTDSSKFYLSADQRMKYAKEIKSKHNIPESSYVFGNMSRTTREKGQDVLIRAFAKFLHSHNSEKEKFYLLIVGGGELEASLKDLSKELKIDPNVVITGRFREEDKVKYLAAFDIFVFPSLAEGFGIVLMESLVIGIPTLCSDLEVLKEVGGKYITTFKVGDVNDLSEKMENEYKKVCEEGKFILEGAKEFIENKYSIDLFEKNYENLYMKLLGEIK